MLFVIMAVLAFISIISFFQINSYWADHHHFNGVFGWLGIGIVFAIGAVVTLIVIAGRSGGSTNRND